MKKPEVPEGYKYCPSCDTVKKIEDFAKQQARKDGRSNNCRKCNYKNSLKYKSRNLTFCGLENDITGFSIGKPMPSNTTAKYYLEKDVKFTENK